MSKSIVLNTSSHIVDLDDGREIEPGKWAEDVDTDASHNAHLLEDGTVRVLSSVPNDTPRPAEDPEPETSVAVAPPAPALSEPTRSEGAGA
jgi:hypothetical protein